MNARRTFALIEKELRELLRDRVTLGLAIVMPLVLLFLFGYAVNLEVKGLRFGVYDGDGTPASRELLDRFTATEYFHLQETFKTLREAEAALQRARVRLVLIIPAQFEERLIREESAPVQVLIDGTFSMTAALASAYASAIIDAYPGPSSGRIEVEPRVWYNPSLRSANFVVPGLFAVILMAFPPLLTALAIVREKETGTIQQIYVSPATSAEFVAAKLVPYGLVAAGEMAMLVIIGTWWFGVPFAGSPLLFAAAALVYVFTTVAVGLFVSSITRTQLSAMLVALIATLMPSFLFSGFLFPVFTMPFSTQLVSRLAPASYFMDVSRGIVLKGTDLGAIWLNVALLAAYAVVVFALATWRLKQKVAP